VKAILISNKVKLNNAYLVVIQHIIEFTMNKYNAYLNANKICIYTKKMEVRYNV